jgi:hypothetical protein
MRVGPELGADESGDAPGWPGGRASMLDRIANDSHRSADGPAARPTDDDQRP